jgi:hypothetical protein
MSHEPKKQETKRPYQPPTLTKHRRLAEVTEGVTPVTVSGGGGGAIITPTSTD